MVGKRFTSATALRCWKTGELCKTSSRGGGGRMHQLIGSGPAPRRGPQPLFSSQSRNLKPNGPCVHKELAKFQVRKLDLMYTKRWNNKQKGAPEGGPSPSPAVGLHLSRKVLRRLKICLGGYHAFSGECNGGC